jgi:predicted PurR-regulated permease PerM
MAEHVPRSTLVFRSAAPVAGNPSSILGPMAIGIIVIAALYFGREVFVPLALAILLSFALGPLVLLLRRAHFGRILSVAASVVLAFAVIFGMGAIIGGQLTGLAENLPTYQYNITEKIASIRRATAEGGLVQRASTMLNVLRNEVSKTPTTADGGSAASTPRTSDHRVARITPPAPVDQRPPPIRVEIDQPDPVPLQLMQNVVEPLLQPLTTTGIVVVFVVFFLLKREDLRDRFIRLAGARDLRRTTEALDDATNRLSRYLLIQSAINSGFGVLVGLGLWAIGVPNPILWGVLAMLLRFVPYIGSVIAAAFPAALAVAVDPGWSMLLWTLALFLVAEPITGQLIEPWLYGRNTGISAVAIVIAAVFWTWLWGPIGLLLSTPLTVCLVVLGRHVERLGFLDIVLGDRPALAPEEGFYQRVLAGDPDEAAYQAEEFLKSRPLSAYYDEVAIKGLALAQLDMNRGGLNHERRVQIKEAVDGIIDDLSDHDDISPTVAQNAETVAELPPGSEDEVASGWREKAVMCVAGRGLFDEASAAMLVQLLGKHGIGARVVPCEAVSPAAIFRLDVAGVEMAVLCYMEAGGFSNARYLVRRLRRKLPQARVVIGFWTLGEEETRHREALAATGADGIVTSLRQAVDQVAKIAIASGSRLSPMAQPRCQIDARLAAE